VKGDDSLYWSLDSPSGLAERLKAFGLKHGLTVIQDEIDEDAYVIGADERLLGFRYCSPTYFDIAVSVFEAEANDGLAMLALNPQQKQASDVWRCGELATSLQNERRQLDEERFFRFFAVLADAVKAHASEPLAGVDLRHSIDVEFDGQRYRFSKLPIRWNMQWASFRLQLKRLFKNES
jgi:hypothetical protein